jgi:NADH:ubiquinone oxidoreductase subunit F (NADH-binding)
VRAAQGDAVVIGNGAEGEPDSRKDLALLEFRPHLVLDGLACTAEALGAREVIVWLHRDADVARVAVTHALAERRAAGLREPKVRVELGPSGYLSGESSAVVRALSGGPARPTFRPLPFAPQRLGGRPALVNNVDTLARVGLLVRGAATDTVLVTVTIGDARIVVEAGSSTLVHDLLARIGGVDSGAVLLGGYGGVWAGWDQLSGVRVSEADLRRRGLSLGAGVLSVLPADRCGLARTAELADYLAQQSAGQCGPCLFGLRSVADAVAALTRGGRRSRSQVRELGRYLAEVRGRGACGHPDGAVRMVSSALTVFADDVNAHLRGRCVARVGHQ